MRVVGTDAGQLVSVPENGAGLAAIQCVLLCSAPLMITAFNFANASLQKGQKPKITKEMEPEAIPYV